jgi:hypothetical protein
MESQSSLDFYSQLYMIRRKIHKNLTAFFKGREKKSIATLPVSQKIPTTTAEKL